MTDKDTITLPREVVKEALAACYFAERADSNAGLAESIAILRTALAAPRPEPDDSIPLHKSDCALLIGGYQCTCGFHQRQNKTPTALAAEQPKPEPVAYFDLQKQVFYWARPTMIDVPMTIALEPLPLYAAPPEDEALRRDAERYKLVLNWLWRYGLLSREKTRIDTPESYGDWWILRKPKVIDGSSLLGYGKTEDAAIDAAMKEGT